MSETVGGAQTDKKQCVRGKSVAAMFISALFIVVMLCGALELPLYQCLRRLPFFVKLVGSLLAEVTLAVNIFAIGRMSYGRLLKEMMALETFRRNERWFSIVRCVCYARTIVTFIAAVVSESFRLSACFGVIALVDAILLVYCVSHTALRGSFRRYPSLVVALSGGILYVALLMLPYPTDLLFGFLNGAVVYSVVTRLATYLATGLVVAALVGVAGTLGSKSVDRLYTSETGGNSDKWENFKRLRLRLLTHLWTHPQNFAETVRCCYTLLAVFAAAAVVSIFVPLLQVTAPEEPSFSFFLGILGTGFLFIGIILYFNVLDENLLKAEYSYVCFKLLYLKKTDIQQKTMRWKDFCQVVSNLYCSRAGITSEEDFFHSLWGPALKDLSEGAKSCEAHLVLCLIQAHQRTAQMYFMNPAGSELEDNERIAADLIQQHCKSIRINQPTEQTTFNELLCFALDCMVRNCGKSWERRFQKLGLSLEKATAILFVDILRFYLCKQPENILNCRVRTLCKGGADKGCICGNPCANGNGEIEINQKVFLLSFPVTVHNCMKARWGNAVLEDTCWKDFEAYYLALYEGAQNSTANINTMKKVFEQWFMDIYPHYQQVKLCVSESVKGITKDEGNDGNKTRIVDAIDEAMKANWDGIISKNALESIENSEVLSLKKLVFLELYKRNTLERGE